MNKEQFVKNAALSGRLAAEGMVLLENKEDLLRFLRKYQVYATDLVWQPE